MAKPLAEGHQIKLSFFAVILFKLLHFFQIILSSSLTLVSDSLTPER